jgi:hypothetical protein
MHLVAHPHLPRILVAPQEIFGPRTESGRQARRLEWSADKVSEKQYNEARESRDHHRSSWRLGLLA